MTLGVLTTLWQRHALERITLGHLSDLDLDGVGLELIAVGSEGDASRAVAEEAGWDYIEYENDPLGRKHNIGMLHMQERTPDAVMVIGSDDLVSHSYIEEAITYLRRGSNYVCPQTLYVLDPSVPRCMYVWGFRVGTGRIIGSELLDGCSWKPWDSDINESLDGSLHNAVQDEAEEQFIGDIRSRGHAIVDVKTDVNIWSYEHLAGALHKDPADPEQVLNEHFPAIVEDVLAL